MDQLQLSPPYDPVELPWERSQVRVPREDGGLLSVPSLRAAPAAAVRNREHCAYSNCQIQGQSLHQFRQQVVFLTFRSGPCSQFTRIDLPVFILVTAEEVVADE